MWLGCGNGNQEAALPSLHLVKLCVGVENVEHLQSWQDGRMAFAKANGERENPVHVTRMFPKRGDELLAGGSLYWVIKGVIAVRQRIVALEEVRGEDGIRRCRIVFDPQLVRTMPQPKRAFQGWRYLKHADAPDDLPGKGGGSDLPPELVAHLREIGAW